MCGEGIIYFPEIPRNYPKEVFSELTNEMLALKKPIIVTHSGRFHTDEVIAVAMLLHLPQYKDAIVLRTRNKDYFDKGTIFVDVGQEYNHEKLRYDHHQRDFNEYYSPIYESKVKLSSAGLIFRHYGDDLLKHLFKDIDQSNVQACKDRIYERFMCAVDGVDNGVSCVVEKGISFNYITDTDIASRVHRLNFLAYNNIMDSNAAFVKALPLAFEQFMECVFELLYEWLPSFKKLHNDFKNRGKYHKSGRVLVLTEPVQIGEQFYIKEKQFFRGYDIVDINSNEIYVPNLIVKDEDYEYLKKCGILYVIYEANDAEKSWRLRCVTYSFRGFKSRVTLPEDLWGRPREYLQSKHKGLQFVHPTGFICGFDTLSNALSFVDTLLA